jgi:glyoxylase-like metal-dependent hydrolase (beta-lactamase superfamily II)
MKTSNRIIGLLIIVTLSSGLLTAQERESVPVSLQKISEHVYQVNGGQGSNGGAIIGENAVLLIDSKMDEESVDQTINAVKELTDKPIKYLFNTHSDGDHIMGNRYLPGSLVFMAHKNCRDDFFKENFGRESDWDEPELYPFTPSVTFKKNMDLWLGNDKVEFYYFGVGHTTGDAFVYFPEEKVAFIGDMYFSGRPQLIHSIKNGNTFEYVSTMKNMLETLDAEIFLSGHSDPVGRDDIKKHLLLMVEMQDKVKELVKQGKTQDETLAAFEENEARLVTSIYNEVKGQDPNQSKENPY